MNSLQDIFALVQAQCREQISEVAYEQWIRGLEPLSADSETAVLLAPSAFCQQIVGEKYLPLLEACFETVMGFPMKVEISTDASLAPVPAIDAEFIPELEYTFETFVVGSSNQFAHAAACAVADNPAVAWNPLFLYGRSGLGKTHLMYAVCNRVRRTRPELNILYVKGEEFSNELIRAIARGSSGTTEFKDKYRHADLLAVDDIQFIAGKPQTQEEFFHTFNTLYESRKQNILTSDRPPKEIKTLEDRLRTRFECGLISDIQPPDFETRVAIISRKAALFRLELPEEIKKFIAAKCTDNIRQLEGIVKRLYFHNHAFGSAVTQSLAETVIRDIMTANLPVPVTVERVIEEVARTYGVAAEDVKSLKRSTQISTARQVAMYLIREITSMSYADIGKEFGNREHSTVLYSVQCVEKLINNDRYSKEMIDDLKKNIEALTT